MNTAFAGMFFVGNVDNFVKIKVRNELMVMLGKNLAHFQVVQVKIQ